MATTTTISRAELARQAALAFEGRTLKVMLCEPTTALNENSSVAEWQAAELSGSGYVRFSEEIGTGAYSETLGGYALPLILAEFTASGGTLSYSKVVLYIDGETEIYALVSEDPNVFLVSGQTQSYKIPILQTP